MVGAKQYDFYEIHVHVAFTILFSTESILMGVFDIIIAAATVASYLLLSAKLLALLSLAHTTIGRLHVKIAKMPRKTILKFYFKWGSVIIIGINNLTYIYW